MKRVYFIKPVGMDGPVKIGCSDLPKKRLTELALWSPWPLEIVLSVPGNISDENYLHCCFAKSHSHHEWFHMTDKLRDAMEWIKQAGTVDVIRELLEPEGSIRSQRKDGWPPEVRLRTSYSSRIRHARERLRKQNPNGAWHEPEDVEWIMARWRGTGGFKPVSPTPAEIARLDEYLADPAAHSVVSTWSLEAA